MEARNPNIPQPNEVDELDAWRRRVSIDQATDIARKMDGLAPGAIVAAYELDDFPDITNWLEIIPEEKQEDSVSDLIASWSNYEDYIDETAVDSAEISSALHHIYSLRKVGDILLELSDEESTFRNSRASAEQKKIVREIFEEFQEIHQDSSFDPQDPGSAQALNDFVRYYKDTIMEIQDPTELTETLSTNRLLLSEALVTTEITRQIGAKNAQRIRKHYEEQPIIIADPLTTLIQFAHIDSGNLGWFLPDKRRCYIDPYSIANKHKYSPDKARLIQAQILKTQAHELMHAAVNDKTWVTVDDERYQISAKDLWPNFYYEAMVEKSAFMVAVAARPELFTGNSNEFYESDLRNIFSLSPKEVLATKKVQTARKSTSSSYVDFRLVVDTVFEKADWQAAGLTQKQAHKLAINAFFDRQDEFAIAGDQSSRKKFISALSAATNPGFLNRLGQLIRFHGSHLALDVLESSKFDPHDTNAFPFLISDRQLEKKVLASERLARERQALSRMQEIGAPEIFINRHVENIEVLEKSVHELNILMGAIRALPEILRHKFGSRQLRSRSRSEILLATIFGDKKFDEEDTKHSPYKSPDIDKFNNFLENWKKIQAANRKR